MDVYRASYEYTTRVVNVAGVSPSIFQHTRDGIQICLRSLINDYCSVPLKMPMDLKITGDKTLKIII